MTVAIELKGLFPDIHAEKIGAFFKDQGDDPAGREALTQVLGELKAFYVVCFTNRCGSNYFAQSLASDGRLRQAGENLNFDTVLAQSERHGLKSFEGYLAWLIRRQMGPEKVFGVKASAGQLVGLYNAGVLRAVEDRLFLMHVTRKDVMAQAVSYYLALHTKQWTSTQSAEPVTVAYDAADIVSMANLIARQNAAFAMLFNLLGVEPMRFEYDKFVAEPVKALRRVSRRLGLAPLKLLPQKVTYEKQADERNQQMLAQLAQDFRLRTPMPPASETEQDQG